jgi:hypothetical protein
MATIVPRQGKNGQQVYRAQVRRKGAPPLSATFAKLADARKWVQVTEAAILEGRHFKTADAKRHTVADLIERYSAAMSSPGRHRRRSMAKRYSSAGGRPSLGITPLPT